MTALLALLAIAIPIKDLHLNFNVKSTKFTASLSNIGESGLIRIEAEPTKGNTLAFLDIVDDFSFEGLRLLKFGIKGTTNVMVVMAEYYKTSWLYARFFVVTEKSIREVLGFSHRNPDNIRLSVDKSGNLTKIVFEDRWAGMPPPGSAQEGALRWHLVTSYSPEVSNQWKPKTSKWKLMEW